jgi:hypothetical protein
MSRDEMVEKLIRQGVRVNGSYVDSEPAESDSNERDRA